MPSVFNGALTGDGVVHISDSGVVVSDIDAWVSAIGTQVGVKGAAGHRLLTRAGWIQFFNSTYNTSFSGQPSEASTDPIWFNSEAENYEVHMNAGGTATDFYYWISYGSTVHVNVSTP